jgi:hypothetical protein
MSHQSPTIVCLGCGYDLNGLDRHRCPECGRPFDPSDPATFGTSREHYLRLVGLLRAGRPVTLPAVVAFVWWVAVGFRTSGEGGAWPGRLLLCMFVAVCYGLIPAAVLWLGLRRRRYLLAVALTAFLPTLLSEAYATVEERLFVASCRDLPPATPTVFKDRWWPNRNHYLFFEPSTGELGGGD